VTRSAFVALLGLLLGVASLSANVGREIRIPLGSARGPLMMSGLGPSSAVWSLPDQEAGDARRDFYFRPIETSRSRLVIPLRPLGPFRLGIRMDTTVRTRVDLMRPESETVMGGEFVPTGPWRESAIAENVDPAAVDLSLRFEDAPLVRRSDPGNFRRYVDEFTVRNEAGFELPWESRLAGGTLVLLLVSLARFAGFGIWTALVVVAAPGLLYGLSFHDPVALALALPRLVGFATLSAALVFLIGRRLSLRAAAAAHLALLGSVMVSAYGFLSFLPDHSPADLDIHIWRTLDLGAVPMTYEGWLRYGSHYPTPSQIRGSATEALGEGPAIPYSPLPYLFFYAAHAAGLDLHWSINAIGALSLSLLLPLIFAFASRASTGLGGFVAAALMAVDLATVHHLGRAHFPAVVGGALGIGGLLAFGLALPGIDQKGRWRLPALFLGLGALGYSSTPLFYALFGLAMIALLVRKDERSRLGPVALALGAGGVIALLLYYGHYVPGLLGGGATPLASDPYPGRTFFIFHNESRQSLRLWRLGLWFPFLAALPATWFVIVHGSAAVRSFLLAWLSAWAGIMLLKEPWGLPILLRWAKEDLYVAPALALLIAIAIGRLESRSLRVALAGLSVAACLYLRAVDYGFHANTLRFLR
jgi:hypothetical protein